MTEIQKLPIKVTQELAKVSEIAAYLWQREWAERNAGNISINFTGMFQNVSLPENTVSIEAKLPAEAGGMVLFVTGTGCHLRHLRNKIDEVACIIKINDAATSYAIIWGGKKKNFGPTCELISHVKIHIYNTQHQPSLKVILHTHPIELIVLSHHLLFQDEKEFNKSLWKMCPEIRVFVPRGVHCTSYALSSSEALANKSIEGLKDRDILLWEKHGALACGPGIEEAFDLIDVANKGAKLLLTAWNAGFQPVGLSDDELKELEQFL